MLVHVWVVLLTGPVTDVLRGTTWLHLVSVILVLVGVLYVRVLILVLLVVMGCTLMVFRALLVGTFVGCVIRFLDFVPGAWKDLLFRMGIVWSAKEIFALVRLCNKLMWNIHDFFILLPFAVRFWRKRDFSLFLCYLYLTEYICTYLYIMFFVIQNDLFSFYTWKYCCFRFIFFFILIYCFLK